MKMGTDYRLRSAYQQQLVFSILILYANKQNAMSDLSKIKLIHVQQKHKAQMYYKR